MPYNGSLRIELIVEGDGGFPTVQEAVNAIGDDTEELRTAVSLLILEYRKKGLKVIQPDDSPEIFVGLDEEESE